MAGDGWVLHGLSQRAADERRCARGERDTAARRRHVPETHPADGCVLGGSLLGGAFFHMLPASLDEADDLLAPFVWTLAGFTVFFALEQFMHCTTGHRESAQCRKPVANLILFADGVHNFIGGLAVGATFLVECPAGHHDVARGGGARSCRSEARGLRRARARRLDQGQGARLQRGFRTDVSARRGHGLRLVSPGRRDVPRAVRCGELPLHCGVGPGSE